MSGKRPASESVGKAAKVARKVISMDVKMQVIQRVEAGERQADVGRSLGLASSTIKTILDNSERIKRTSQLTTSLVATKVSRTRNRLLEKMESWLSMWVEDQNKRHIPLSQLIIMEKARNLFTYLQEQEGEGSSMDTFMASRGWFEKFKRRSNLHSIRITDEAASANEQAAHDYPNSFNRTIQQGEPVSSSAKDLGDKAVETEFPVTQELCEASPPPAQDPQETSELHTIDGSTIKDDGSVAEEVEFPMTLETPGKFPSPVQDPLRPKQIQMQRKSHFKDVMEALACDEAFVDVTLTAEGRAIRAHKLVLSAVSPYFQQVLFDNPCRHPVIIMPYHVQFDHLTHIVEYMYKGEITIAEDQVEPLLKTAKLLQVTGLATSDSAPLIAENRLSTAPEMNHPPARSSNVAKHQSCSSGGTVPLISTSKVIVHKSDSHKASKPSYSSSVTFKSPSASVVTPPKSTNAQLNISKMVNTLVSFRALESEALCGSAATTLTGIRDVPVNISRPLSAESSTDDRPIQEDLSDAEIDIKEEEILCEDKEENVEFMIVDDTPQEASRRDPLGTHQKPSRLHSAGPNSDTLPDPFLCPYCEEKHIDVNKMRVHLNRKHPFRPKFICVCGRVFVRPIQHQVHTKLCSNSS